jgi:mannose-6-phosphate isomerase-like protein (cupin superfamily)
MALRNFDCKASLRELSLRFVSEYGAKGVRMWSVALEKTMFTYFEIDPESRFELHSHVNEQITMVLEREIFFKFRERIVCVKKGEVLAIPSSTPHDLFTQNSSVIAVDA